MIRLACRRARPALAGALALTGALVAAGCGSSSPSSHTSASPGRGATPGASHATAAPPAASHATAVPAADVALVDGSPITVAGYDSWVQIAVKTAAAESPGSSLIVPTGPPEFSSCVAQERSQDSQLAATPVAQLRADCEQVFTPLNREVMDFLIRGKWYLADAAAHGISFTASQTQQALGSQTRSQYPTAAGFQRFLRQTGQTEQDVIYRVQISEAQAALSNRTSGGLKAVDADVQQRYRADTFCAPQYRIADCAG